MVSLFRSPSHHSSVLLSPPSLHHLRPEHRRSFDLTPVRAVIRVRYATSMSTYTNNN